MQHERELHQLRRLELQRAGAEPAARAVDGRRRSPGSSTSTSSTKAPSSSAGVKRRTCSRPWRASSCITTSPQRAVHEVLDEVGGAVAVALEQRARRGRRVDHHRAAGEQAERGREEQSVLERLLPGLWPSGLDSTGRAGRLPARHGAPLAVASAVRERAEVLAALLERAVLVIGRACGRQQHDLARRRRRRAPRPPRAPGRRSRARARRCRERRSQPCRPPRRSGTRRVQRSATAAASGA